MSNLEIVESNYLSIGIEEWNCVENSPIGGNNISPIRCLISPSESWDERGSCKSNVQPITCQRINGNYSPIICYQVIYSIRIGRKDALSNVEFWILLIIDTVIGTCHIKRTSL